MNYFIFDAVIVVILLLFALWGRHRGLILSVFSLLALVVAIAGGLIVSNALTPAVTGWVHPMVENTVVTAVQSALPEEALDVLDNIATDNTPSENFSLDALQDYLDESGIELPEQVQEVLERMNEEELSSFANSTSVEEMVSTAAKKVTETIVRIVLFLLAFVLILILWHVLARALDLVSRLPVLNSMNKLGGFLFGAVRGLLFLFVVAWILQWYSITNDSLIPSEAIEQTCLLKFFLTAKPLEILASL